MYIIIIIACIIIIFSICGSNTGSFYSKTVSWGGISSPGVFGSSVLSYSRYNEDNDEGDGEGSGNFTDVVNQNTCNLKRTYMTRIRPDFRYLEDIMNNDKNTDVNPGYGYKRTFGGNEVVYNTNISDNNYKTIQYEKNYLLVPWSNLYNYLNSYPLKFNY